MATMSKICALTGKKPSIGMNVSHSKRHTKRWVKPNVTKHVVTHPETKIRKTVYLSTRAWKTLKTNPSKVYALFA